jgi:hypothetical protein
VASSSPEAQPAIKVVNLTAPRGASLALRPGNRPDRHHTAPRTYNITAGSRNALHDLAWHPTQELLLAAVGSRFQVMSLD